MQFARYYDLQPDHFEGKEIIFFIPRISKPRTRILEPGCGTGRVLIPVARYCEHIEGMDGSKNMLTVCYEKLRAAKLAHLCKFIEPGDMSNFDLGRQFDPILVPFMDSNCCWRRTKSAHSSDRQASRCRLASTVDEERDSSRRASLYQALTCLEDRALFRRLCAQWMMH